MLRPLEESDLTLLANWRGLKAASEQFFSPWLTAYSEQRRWYEKYLASGERTFIIQTREAKPVGMLALVGIDKHHQCAELGRVFVDPGHTGEGYAGDAVKAIVKFAFEEMNLHRLEAKTLADNERAIRCYEQCGFIKEGLLRAAAWKGGQFRDVVVMGVVRA